MNVGDAGGDSPTADAPSCSVTCPPVTLASGLDNPTRIALGSACILVSESDDPGLVGRVALDGGAVVALVRNQNGPAGLAVNAVHWTTAFDGTVMLAPK